MNLRRFRKAETFNKVVTWCLIVVFVVGQLSLAPSARAASPGTTTVSAGTAPPPSSTTVESFQPDLFTGRAATSIPLAVPPGRKNLQPQLSAAYSSASQNGMLGVGWGLDIGFIERSTKTGVPKYDATDVFLFQLGGGSSEMVLLADGTYRAEDEGLFLKFENLGTNGWQVTDKSGTRYLLGRTSASRMENGTQVFRWCLDRVIDPNGNTMDYSYVTYGGQPYPSQIDYTGHTNGLAAANRVTFTWQDRPDIGRSLRSGWEIQSLKRLSKVETWATVSNVLSMASRYQFGYSVSARTGRSLLTSFQKFGSDGVTSLPAMTLAYQSADIPTYTDSFKPGTGSTPSWNVQVAGYDCGHDNYGCVHPYYSPPCGPPPYGATVQVLGSQTIQGIPVSVGSDGSININGAQDAQVHAWTYVYLNTAGPKTFSGSGGDVACLWVEDATGMHGPYGWGSLSSIPFNAGWSVIHIVGYNQNQGWGVALSSSIITMFDLMSPSASSQPQLAGDVDGNGVTDLIDYQGGTWKVSLASTGAIQPPGAAWLSGFGGNGYSPLVGDWNADGRVDVAIHSNGVWRFATSTGSNFVADTIGSVNFGTGSPLSGDFNGDGITDLGIFYDGTWKIAIGSGTGFAYNATYDITMPEGAAQLAPSDVRWRVRAASYDCGHDNYGCIPPGAAGPCGQPNYSTSVIGAGSYNVGGASWSIGANGSMNCNGGQDRHCWASICVYLKNAGSRSFSMSGGDVACFYMEPQGGSISQIPWNGSASFPAGWTTLHMVGYNQNQGMSMGLTSALTSMFDIVSPDIIEPNVSGASQVTGDFNGDGLTDVAIVKGGSVTACTSCRDVLERGQSTGDGYYTIDPDGTGGQAPVSVYCNMSMQSGGWTKLTDTVAGTPLNLNASSSREYLYVYGSAWYRSPVSALVWDWNTGKDLYGTWGSSVGNFNITASGEHTLYGVSGSSGGGGTYKCLIFYPNSKDPANATVQVCQDQPHAFPSTCQDGVTVYLRETAVQSGGGSSGGLTIALANGRGFVKQAAWPVTFGSKEYTTADFNGDGMTDVAYYDRPRGKIQVAYSTGAGLGTPADLPLTLTLRTDSDKIQLGEFNGDGLPDPAIFNPISGDSEIASSSGTAPDLLASILNGLGGTSTIKYQASTRLNNTFLPMPLQVVTESAGTDGMGSTNKTTYTYQNGLYDSATREFRGFGHVEVRDADQSVATMDYHQDYQRKGRAFRTAAYDVDGNLWTKEENIYSASVPYAGRPSYFTHLDQRDSYTYDGNTTYKQARIRHTYDAYGNLTASYLDGDVNVTGDEKSTLTTFNVNPTAWILNTASLVQTLDASSNVVMQLRTYYDGAATLTTPPTRGNITREEKLLDLPATQWIGSGAAYDPYGNVSVSTDPLGRSVTNAYDATFTYMTVTKSPLGHRRTQTYDPRFGLVVSVTDQNNVTGNTTYDALGRKVSEAIVNPVTLQTVVQSETEYRMNTVPNRIKTTAYAQPGKAGPITTFAFMDGWGRRIQVREPAEEAGKQRVSGAAAYDGKGRMIKQWTAYADNYSEEYVPTSGIAGLAPPEQYTYDPLGRITSRQTSSGSMYYTSYDNWVTTYTDANGHVRRMTTDAYGRVVRAEEVNGAATYVTTYAYDIRNNLIRATDHLGNQVSSTFDSLGRKIATDDPDLGHWTYAFNAKDLMTNQVDARGVSIAFTFDAMDRLVRKDYTTPAGIDPMPGVVYTYDDPATSFATGRLTRVVDGSGTNTFAYDFMNHVATETRVIDGTSYAMQNSYDLLGRQVSYTYPNGHVAAYTYNTAGGLETMNLVAGSTTNRIITDVTYNAAGKVTRIAYGNGVVSDYSYNPQTLSLAQKRSVLNGTTVLQDLSYTRDPVGNVSSITDAVNTGTQTFQYDALDRLVQATGASYGSQAFAYDAIGNMTSKAGVTMTYGAGSVRPHAVTTTSAGLALTYDANGNMTGRVSSATGTLAMRYDAENRLAEVRATAVAPSTVALAPGLNLVGLPSVGATTAVTNAFKQFGTAYTQVTRMRALDQKFESCVGNAAYDQFTTVTPGDGYWVNVTNAAGATMNLPAVAGTPAARSLTNGWQLLAGPARPMTVSAWMSPLVAGTDYGLVKAYNTSNATLVVTNDVAPGKAYYVQILRPCTWTPCVAGQTETTRYVYDADGERVKQTAPAGTTIFVGVNYEVQGSTTTEYVLNGSDRVASLTSSGVLRYYLTDHLNSANLVVDNAGQVVELAEYAPYGQLSRRSGTADTPFKFTGQRFDAGTGLYFYGARYYDPELGRFVSPDTTIQDNLDPQTLNRYSYARNNPILFTDPSGNLFIIDDILIPIIIAAIIGAAVNVAMAAINGGDLGQAALLGAVSGAITWGFGAIAESMFAGTGAMAYLGRAAVNAVGGAASGAAGAAIKGEPVGKGALEGFKMSAIMSAANYAVGQWSGYSKKGEALRLRNLDMKPDGIKDIGVNGITMTKDAALKELKNFDEFIYNPTHGWMGLTDIVECAQELFFGPSSFSRELGGYFKGLSGQQVSIVAHSQGTILTARALQLAGRQGTKFAAGSTVTFNNPPIDILSAYGAGWACGLKVAYVPSAQDFVSALGSPVFLPTSIPFITQIGKYHCAYSFENAFPHN